MLPWTNRQIFFINNNIRIISVKNMNKSNYLCCIAAGLIGLAATPSNEGPTAITNEDNENIVFVIPIDGVINPSLVYVVRRGVEKAAADERVAAIIFEMDTDGGRLDVTERIIRLIQNLDVPTYTFVNAKAFSAGAIIAMATDYIYMAENSVIGDAMPIMVSPLGGAQEMPEGLEEKMVSAVAALIRSAAQNKGHDPQLAEAMVRREIEYAIDGEVISPAGQLLTLTNVEAARRFGKESEPLLSRGTVADIEALIENAGLQATDVVRLTIRAPEQFARLIESLSFLLLAGGLLGLYIEIRTPGFGLPGIVGLLLLAIWFWGHHIAGLSGILELTFFLAGFALLLIELFLIPGFGAAGLAGLTLMAGAILMSMIDIAPGGPILPRELDLSYPLRMLTYTILTTGAGMYLITVYLPGIPLFRRIILEQATDKASGYQTSEATDDLVGRQGVTLTALRPAGACMFDDRRLDVVTEGEFIEAGVPVKISETHGNRIIVQRLRTG